MAWELLPTNYTDAIWDGLKRYNEITNSDGTVSFQDVTVYSKRENSFFGAKDANRMNEALNTIMSVIENGTNIYEEFQNYFKLQKKEFELEADNKQKDFDSYLSSIKNSYSADITSYKANQEDAFNSWFDSIKDKLSSDSAGKLQNQITDLDDRLDRFAQMIVQNEYYAPLEVSDGVVLTDGTGAIFVADWHNATTENASDTVLSTN